MNKKRIVVLAVILLFWVSLASAQWPRQERSIRERIRENINYLRLLRMTEMLELNEEQTAKIYPAANRIEKERKEITRKMEEEIRALRDLLRDENPDKQGIARKVRAIKEMRRSVQDKELELEAVVEESLNDIQKAKYLIFMVDFYRGLGEKLNRAREMARERRKS